MARSFQSPLPFITKARKTTIGIVALDEKSFKTYVKSAAAVIKKQIETAGFEAKAQTALVVMDAKGAVDCVLLGVSAPISHYDGAYAYNAAKAAIGAEALKTISFEFSGSDTDGAMLEKLHIGWGLASYKFDAYSEKKPEAPLALLWSAKANKTRVQSLLEAILTLKNMINTPANDCGPDELEQFTKELAQLHSAKISVIKDQKLIEKNFPLIYAVGMASPRRPRLIELNWGDASHPKLTLVGKGVCFDTGGLDIKPSQFMRYMKKDMGGAAHALNLAHLVMAHQLPVRLKVLVAAVENSVSGESFRPGDIFKSRKGTFIENTNTDAEGRLILADTLTYACEDDPELVIDFATLTGSARAALGPDIPAMFSNNDTIGADLQKAAFAAEDPVWQMPLWPDYKKHLASSAGDVVNSSGIPGDLVYSALFLESFLTEGKDKKVPDWVHLDCYAWEQTGRPGRPAGAADTSLRAVFAFLETRYGDKKAKTTRKKK